MKKILTTKSNRFSTEILPHIQQQIMAKALQFLGKTKKVMFGTYYDAETLEDGTVTLPQHDIPEVVSAEFDGKNVTFKFASE